MKFEYGTMNICMKIWVYGICVWFCMELVKFRVEKYRCLYNSMGLYSFGYKNYRYMVWNPLSRVWFGFVNSQPHLLLGLS